MHSVRTRRSAWPRLAVRPGARQWLTLGLGFGVRGFRGENSGRGGDLAGDGVEAEEVLGQRALAFGHVAVVHHIFPDEDRLPHAVLAEDRDAQDLHEDRVLLRRRCAHGTGYNVRATIKADSNMGATIEAESNMSATSAGDRT
jgi:hypothetical protein